MTQIKWRVQDEENLKEQLAAEGRKSVILACAVLTVERAKDLATFTELSMIWS